LHCILWRESPTYETKPASLLSVQKTHKLSADVLTAFPLGAEVLLRDFYVDDLTKF